MSEFEPIPEGFLAKLLQEFGFQWTHLVIISGIVFSSFGLQKYMNSGVWILGTVLAFSLVYLFRSRISGNLLKVSLWAGLASVLAFGVPFFALLDKHQDIPLLIEAWSKLATLYASLALGIPVGVTILSYKAQEEMTLTPLPAELSSALKSVSRSSFVHERVAYLLEFSAAEGGGVAMHMNVEMHIFNRSQHHATYRDVFGSANRNNVFYYAEINQTIINVEDPERRFSRGLKLEHRARGQEHFRVVVNAKSTYHGRDAEFVGVYLPCSSLNIKIPNPTNEFSIQIESLLRDKVDARRLPNGDLIFEYENGILPHQGVRVSWNRSASNG